MNASQRLQAVLRGEPVDRLPVMEWAPWWHLTRQRWYGEGLPADMTDPAAIAHWLGLDPVESVGIRPRGRNTPPPRGEGGPRLPSLDADGYEAIKPLLYPDPAPIIEDRLALSQTFGRDYDPIRWLVLDGFFWFPRTLFGIETHLYAFYDHGDLMRRMNDDLLAFNLRYLDSLIKVWRPSFVTLAEDMSYNHGPMLSEDHFETFIAPYYRVMTQWFKDADIPLLIDSDGDVTTLLPWMHRAGVRGILPLERAAGVDIVALTRDHPDWHFIGAFDKQVMKHGADAIAAEFARLEPAIAAGRYVPGVDHQTPPDVSLEMYREYARQLREVAIRHGSGAGVV